MDISVFRNYPIEHPFRLMLENGYDENNKPIMSPKAIPAINSLQALCRPLGVLQTISTKAYHSFINDKLVAKKGKDGFDGNNLLSALCELAVMYTFIMASDVRDSFIYEPRLLEGIKKNVEFSIVVHGKKYNVEVKSANLLKHNEEFQDAMEKTGSVVEPVARILPLEDWKDVVQDSSLLPSLDNKLADFLASAQEKFPPINDSVNLLVVCWDGTYRKALTALKSKVNGLMTEHSYKPDLQYDHISHVLVSTTYGVILGWLGGRVPYPISCDPFNMRFHQSFLLDYNLDNPSGIQDHLQKTLSCCKLPIVNEAFVSEQCEEVLFHMSR